MAFLGLFGKKNGGGDAEAEGKYAAFGQEVAADIQRFMTHVAKDWQVAVHHHNFERSPFELQVKIFLERHEHELAEGKYPYTLAYIRAGKIKFNDIAFDAMSKAVVTITALKLMDGFEKAGRKVS